MASEVRGFTPRILLKYLQERTCFRWAAITSDSCSVASQQRVLLMKTSADQTAKVWDAQSGKELLTLLGHSESVYGVASAPMASASPQPVGTPLFRSMRSTHANYSTWRAAVSPAPSLPMSANATSSPRPARPCLNLGVQEPSGFSSFEWHNLDRRINKLIDRTTVGLGTSNE
jgi:WD40 repeat protein